MSATDFDTRRLAKRIESPGSEWAKTTRSDIRVLELSRSRVRVRMREGASGAARTILFAADPPMVVEQYDAHFDALASLGRVACFETPGFGFSFPRSGFGFSRRDYADALVELLERLDAGPYVLVFPCWTAYQAIDAAHARSDLVEGLVLMQAASWEEQLRWSRLVARAFGLATLGVPLLGDRLFAAPYLGQALCALIERRFVDRTTRFVVYKARARRELVARFLAAGNDAFRHGACNCQASVFQAYFREGVALPTLTQPGLVLWGTKDPSHRRSDRAGLVANVPKASVRLIDDTGHHLEHENPKRVCEEIRRFVESLSIPR